MFLAGLFITVPYSVSYLAFAITGKADRKLPIVMNSSRHLHSSQLSLFFRGSIGIAQSTLLMWLKIQWHRLSRLLSTMQLHR